VSNYHLGTAFWRRNYCMAVSRILGLDDRPCGSELHSLRSMKLGDSSADFAFHISDTMTWKYCMPRLTYIAAVIFGWDDYSHRQILGKVICLDKDKARLFQKHPFSFLRHTDAGLHFMHLGSEECTFGTFFDRQPTGLHWLCSAPHV
jgi:hypothetical protein